MINTRELRKEYANLMAACPQEIFVTLRFERERVSEEYALKKCQEFVRRVGKRYKTLAAGWGIFNCRNHPHCHLVLFGKKHSLRSLTSAEAKSLWGCGSVLVIACLDSGAAKYLSVNMTLNTPDNYVLMPFGMNALKKYTRDIVLFSNKYDEVGNETPIT